MGVFRVISSGSKGNAYSIETKDGILLIELGVSVKNIMKFINYNIEKVVGVLVSHSHG